MLTPNLKIYSAGQIQTWLNNNTDKVIHIVEDIYLKNSEGQTINPDSYFLRYPDERNRIIALPASIEDENPISGIKWIASFPDNISLGLDRASAILIVNDRKTGYPIACLEGSLISAVRTATSALVGVKYLHTGRDIEQIGVIGCGLIAYNTINLLKKAGWNIKKISLTDLSNQRSQYFADQLGQDFPEIEINSLENTIRTSDVILFATSASTPYFNNPEWLNHHPTILHMSLRDISPEVILTAQNIADDIDHSVKAQTSLHLAEQVVNSRHFIEGDIADVIHQKVTIQKNKTRIFSPFGMGILDLAVARTLIDEAQATIEVEDFYPVPYVE